jgi:hypothetical protein
VRGAAGAGGSCSCRMLLPSAFEPPALGEVVGPEQEVLVHRCGSQKREVVHLEFAWVANVKALALLPAPLWTDRWPPTAESVGTAGQCKRWQPLQRVIGHSGYDYEHGPFSALVFWGGWCRLGCRRALREKLVVKFQARRAQ